MRTLPIALLLLFSAPAFADPKVVTLPRTCADVSPQGLDEAYRANAKRLLVSTLEQKNLFVVDGECTETYRIEFADNNRQLILDGPGARVTRRLGDSGDLAAEYATILELQRRMRTLADQEANAPASEPVASPPVAPASPQVAAASPDVGQQVDDSEPSATVSPEELPVKNLFYARFGFGGVASTGVDAAFAFGIRHSYSKADLDVSLGGAGPIRAAKVEVLSRPAPFKQAVYGGGGLSLGSFEDTSSYDGHSGGGVAAELSGGIALTPSHKWFVQADLSVPFYMASDVFPMMFSISMGYGLATH